MIAEAVLCLAMNIYHEARDQDLMGQMAVAEVTLNRVKSKKYPNTVCEVVWQPQQFSWTQDGKSDKMREAKAKRVAMILAKAYIEGRVESFFTNGATHYHASYVKPYWSNDLVHTAQIGLHLFYRGY